MSRRAARPKGYAGWRPSEDTLVALARVRRILDEYGSYGPMTARQIFYRLVGQYSFEKSERSYKRLVNYLVRARRAGLIPFGSIRDDGTTVQGTQGWPSREYFWDSVRYTAGRYELDHQLEQPQRIELWCEAAGMAPMLARMVEEWHVPVYSTGGFSSVTVTHEVAERVASRDVPTVLLHVGDFDPSGESIFASMAQDIGAFVASLSGVGRYWSTGGVEGRFEPVRVALTRDQVAEYDLPTAPPKATDSRSAGWSGETTQAEAMPPDLLETVVRAAVEEYIDPDALHAIHGRERRDRAEISRVLAITDPRDGRHDTGGP